MLVDSVALEKFGCRFDSQKRDTVIIIRLDKLRAKIVRCVETVSSSLGRFMRLSV